MYFKKDLFIVLLLLCASPLLALFFVLWHVFLQEKEYLYILAFIMGLLAFLFPPVSDLSRHAFIYEDAKNMSWEGFNELFFAKRWDTAIFYIEYFMAKINIPFEYLRMLLVFISYSLYFKIYVYIVRILDVRDRMQGFLIFSIFFLSITFFGITIGLRYNFAIALINYSVYMVLVRGKKIGYLFAILACFVHYALSIWIFVILVIDRTYIVINKKMLLILILMGGAFSFTLLELVWVYFPSIKESSETYITGSYAPGGDMEMSRSFKHKIYVCLVSFLPYFCGLFVFQKSSKTKISLYNKVVLIAIFLTYSIPVLHGRYKSLIIFPTVIFFFLEYFKSNTYRKYVFVFLYLAFIYQSAQIYTNIPHIIHGKMKYIITPLPVILDNTYENKSYILQNLKSDGSSYK